MELLTDLKNYWLPISGITAFVIWLARLEGRTNNTEKRVDQTEKRIDHAETRVNTIESALVKELSEVKQSLARIEGYLQATKEAGENR